MSNKKVKTATTSYEDWLINSLQDREEAALFLETALEEFQKDGDLKVLLLSLRHVVEAQGGIGQLARKTHLNRESLYKMLSAKGDPKFTTIATLLNAVGVKLAVTPMERKVS
jgi:probable addiction module antidote protein